MAYFLGVLHNLESGIMKPEWDGWTLRLYYDNSVEQRWPEIWPIISTALQFNPRIQLVKFNWPQYQDEFGQHYGLVGTLARFLPFGEANVEVCIARDIDNILANGIHRLPVLAASSFQLRLDADCSAAALIMHVDDLLQVNHWLDEDRFQFHRYYDPFYAWPLLGTKSHLFFAFSHCYCYSFLICCG